MEYYTTHQMFLSNTHAIYLVVCDITNHINNGREEKRAEDQLRYWLRFIASKISLENVVARFHVPARIMLIGTHADQLSSSSQQQQHGDSLFEMIFRRIMSDSTFSSLHPFILPHPFLIDYNDERGESVERVREQIVRSAQEIVSQELAKVPRRYLPLSFLLPQLHPPSPLVPILSLDQFFEQVHRLNGFLYPNTSRDLVLAATRFWHGMGALVFVERGQQQQGRGNDENLNSSLIILNPQWLTKIMGWFVGVKEGAVTPATLRETVKNGEIEERDIHDILARERGISQVEHANAVMKALERFEMCWSYRDANNQNHRRFVFPALLPAPPDFSQIRLELQAGWRVMSRRLECVIREGGGASMIPPGFFIILQSRIQQAQQLAGAFKRHYRHCIHVRRGDESGMIRVEEAELCGCMDIVVGGPAPSSLLQVLLADLIQPLRVELYPGLAWEERVLCVACLQNNRVSCRSWKLEELRSAPRDSKMNCRHDGRSFSVGDLVDGFVLPPLPAPAPSLSTINNTYNITAQNIGSVGGEHHRSVHMNVVGQPPQSAAASSSSSASTVCSIPSHNKN